jgi:hypothetical protein
VLNSDGKVRPRIETNLAQTDYRSRIIRINNDYIYKFEFDINSSSPYVLNVLSEFDSSILKTLLLVGDWVADGDVYKQVSTDLVGIISQNPIIMGDVDIDYDSEYRDFTDLQIGTARAEFSNIYRAIIDNVGNITFYSTSNIFTLTSLPILIRREK